MATRSISRHVKWVESSLPELVRILVIPITGTGFIRSPFFPNATHPMLSL